jgi:hypothetical protein
MVCRVDEQGIMQLVGEVCANCVVTLALDEEEDNGE